MITDREIYYAIKNYRYDLQQAHYVAGLRANIPYSDEGFTLGWCEKSAPFTSRGSILTSNTIEEVEQEYAGLMSDIAYFLSENKFDGPGCHNILEVDLNGD